MRNMLIAALTLGMAMAMSVTASAATLDQANSFLAIKLGSVPEIRVTASSTDVTLSGTPGAHTISEAASVFQTDSFTVQSSAFTGLPQLTALKMSLHAGTGQFDESATYANQMGVGTVSGFGGLEANTGNAVLQAGGFDFVIPLQVFGIGGTTNLAAVLNNVLVVEGAPFNTGAVNITGLSSNIVITGAGGPGGGGGTGVAFTLNLTTVQLLTATELTAVGVVVENATVTITAGTNTLQSASQAGAVKMVSPYRLQTGALAGNVAGAVYKTFRFVPEPGMGLLLVSGVAGLIAIGRRRMKS